LRYDRNQERNEEIRAERLAPEEIAALERSDPERLQALQKSCERLINSDLSVSDCNHLFHCGAGNDNFNISYDGLLRLAPLSGIRMVSMI
jgi:hypothetical protein